MKNEIDLSDLSDRTDEELQRIGEAALSQVPPDRGMALTVIDYAFTQSDACSDGDLITRQEGQGYLFTAEHILHLLLQQTFKDRVGLRSP